MNDDIRDNEWINSRSAFRPENKPVARPKVDIEVSKIVGKEIFVNDPRLVQQVVKWKSGSQNSSDKPDNYLRDPSRRRELKKLFGGD